MAQKLVNFGQKIATATPRLATRVSFQAIGKKIEGYLLVVQSVYNVQLCHCVKFWK